MHAATCKQNVALKEASVHTFAVQQTSILPHHSTPLKTTMKIAATDPSSPRSSKVQLILVCMCCARGTKLSDTACLSQRCSSNTARQNCHLDANTMIKTQQAYTCQCQTVVGQIACIIYSIHGLKGASMCWWIQSPASKSCTHKALCCRMHAYIFQQRNQQLPTLGLPDLQVQAKTLTAIETNT